MGETHNAPPDGVGELKSLLKNHFGERVEFPEIERGFQISMEASVLEAIDGVINEQFLTDDHNLLISCDSSSGSLQSTAVSYVVGAALRGTHVKGSTELEALLSTMGIDSARAAAAASHCHGLSRGMIWALYLDRHGWLIAAPILSMGLGKTLMEEIRQLRSSENDHRSSQVGPMS